MPAGIPVLTADCVDGHRAELVQRAALIAHLHDLFMVTDGRVMVTHESGAARDPVSALLHIGIAADLLKTLQSLGVERDCCGPVFAMHSPETKNLQDLRPFAVRCGRQAVPERVFAHAKEFRHMSLQMLSVPGSTRFGD